MFSIRHHLWHYEETGEPCGESTDQLNWDANPICPKCGQLTEWWEGTIGQDRMGNDERAENWVCYHCKIGTELHEME